MTKARTLGNFVSAGNPLSDGTIAAAEVTGLSTVATTGAYADLSGKPTLPSGDIVGTTDSQTLTNKTLTTPTLTTPNITTGLTIAGAAGTSGQVLTSAGSGAAPTWASPSGGSWVYLATVSASAAATVSFNSTYITSTYDAYVVVFSGWYPDVDRPQYYLRLSTDNNSTFVTCNYIAVRADSASVSSTATSSQSIGMVTTGTFSTSASNGGGSGCVWIYNPSSTSSGRTVTWTLGGYSTNSADQESWYGSGTYRNTTTAINAIRFLQGSGNITGKFVLYGVKAS